MNERQVGDPGTAFHPRDRRRRAPQVLAEFGERPSSVLTAQPYESARLSPGD
ncbi:hypothetical protein FHS42_001400 [Streptomyces zagrosensis]|uniref:Uncharacterized protein n=1 Tax=Streptomyces zagrosensis TaxID=1042984 RepID=A0A7W9Q6Q0_9ACTN|nr:hypothetical protein [Streptomyces zagrosensis]